MNSEEIWKPVPGAEGRYSVSSLGRVRSELRGGRILRQGRTSSGYLMVGPVINGVTRPRKVHHLVLLAFVGPRPDGAVGCHNNDIREDNRPENLRWDTHAANVEDRRRRNGYAGRPKKLTLQDVLAIRRDDRGYKTISRDYGVHWTSIRDVIRRKTWKHVESPPLGRNTGRNRAMSEVRFEVEGELCELGDVEADQPGFRILLPNHRVITVTGLTQDEVRALNLFSGVRLSLAEGA